MNCGVKNYMKVDYRRYHRSYRRNLFAAWNYNYKSCVFNYDDRLWYKNYPVNKPELKKKWEIVGLSSSCNLQSVTISRVLISVLKGRWKLGQLRDFSVPASPLYFLSFPRFFFFFKRTGTNSYVYPLHLHSLTISDKSFTLRCIFSLRTDL